MKIALRPAEMFKRDGYAVLPGFLSDAAVEAMQEEVDKVVAAPHGEPCQRPNNTLIPLRWSDPLVAELLADNERTRRLAETVAADDLRWISGYISTKTPHSPPLWWHQDWWCWDHPVSYRRSPAQIALMCYLTDTGTHNGALPLCVKLGWDTRG